MIAIIDYGVGNLFSLRHSFDRIGREAVVTGDATEIRKAERIVLPGVGAFADAIAKLRDSGLDRVLDDVIKEGKPLLGICLGMQLLFERSYEFGVWSGLGYIPGEIRPIRPEVGEKVKVPHIGWNALLFPKGERHPIFKDTKEGTCVYFVHSYYATGCAPSVIASTEYDAILTAAAANRNVCGVQFHPEKSGEAGLALLRAFCEWEPREVIR